MTGASLGSTVKWLLLPVSLPQRRSLDVQGEIWGSAAKTGGDRAALSLRGTRKGSLGGHCAQDQSPPWLQNRAFCSSNSRLQALGLIQTHRNPLEPLH